MAAGRTSAGRGGGVDAAALPARCGTPAGTPLTSERLNRSHASCTASSASLAEPSIRRATARNWDRWYSNRPTSQLTLVHGYLPRLLFVIEDEPHRADVTHPSLGANQRKESPWPRPSLSLAAPAASGSLSSRGYRTAVATSACSPGATDGNGALLPPPGHTVGSRTWDQFLTTQLRQQATTTA